VRTKERPSDVSSSSQLYSYHYLHAVVRGRQAIEEYLKTGKPIAFYLRQWARRESSFMTAFGTHSRKLALMCLTTRVRNTMCLYHSRHTSSKYSNDHTLSDKRPHVKVTGVAYPWTAVSKQVKGEEDEDDEDDNDESGTETETEVKAGNVLHCGCWTDDALLDLYLWKSTMADSPSTNAREGWKEDLLDPRQRAFVTTAFTRHSGLDVSHLYYVDLKGTKIKPENILNVQFDYLIDKGLNGLAAEAFKKKHSI